MIKLSNILTEVLNTYSVEAEILSDRKESITNILDQIRGLYKVTIVNNITPEEYPQRDKIEYTKVRMKFVTRIDPKTDLSQFKEDMNSMKDTMKGFANTIVPQMKKFAKSDDVKNLKKDAMGILMNKGKDLLNKGQQKIKQLEKQM